MEGSGIYAAKEMFAEVVTGAQVIRVDPSACIPYIRTRNIVLSGVSRLKYSFSARDQNSFADGAVAGGSLPTVVELSGALSRYVVEYFMHEVDWMRRRRVRRLDHVQSGMALLMDNIASWQFCNCKMKTQRIGKDSAGVSWFLSLE